MRSLQMLMTSYGYLNDVAATPYKVGARADGFTPMVVQPLSRLNCYPDLVKSQSINGGRSFWLLAAARVQRSCL